MMPDIIILWICCYLDNHRHLALSFLYIESKLLFRFSCIFPDCLYLYIQREDVCLRTLALVLSPCIFHAFQTFLETCPALVTKSICQLIACRYCLLEQSQLGQIGDVFLCSFLVFFCCLLQASYRCSCVPTCAIDLSSFKEQLYLLVVFKESSNIASNSVLL